MLFNLPLVARCLSEWLSCCCLGEAWSCTACTRFTLRDLASRWSSLCGAGAGAGAAPESASHWGLHAGLGCTGSSHRLVPAGAAPLSIPLGAECCHRHHSARAVAPSLLVVCCPGWTNIEQPNIFGTIVVCGLDLKKCLNLYKTHSLPLT